MMHNPPHPGKLLREDVLETLKLPMKEAAERLGMSRVALSRVLNGRAAISPDLAVRLERACAPLAFASRYNLAKALKHEHSPVKPF